MPAAAHGTNYGSIVAPLLSANEELGCRGSRGHGRTPVIWCKRRAGARINVGIEVSCPLTVSQPVVPDSYFGAMWAGRGLVKILKI